MASTYSTNLAIELIGTGDQAGTWGVTTNSNLGTLIEQAISGYVTQAVATGTDTTITIPNGATGVARNMYIELTGTGGTNTNLIVPSNKKLYFIFNNSTGAVTVKVTGQTGVSVPQGKKMILVSNGTDIVNGVNYIADFGTNSFTVTNLTASSGTITNLIATTASISDASATVLRASSATLTHLSATSASITNLALTSLTISSLNITNVSVASATVSSNLVLSGGTANGVLYLNGSKVATSGSALTFDGTSFAPDGTSRNLGTSSLRWGTVYATALADGADQLVGSSGATVRWGYGSSWTAQAFAISGSEQMRLTSTGLGIGTSSPGVKLDVAGAIRSIVSGGTPIVYLNNGSTQHSIQNESGAFTFYNSGVLRATLDSSGNLGLGVTPSAWNGVYRAMNIGSRGNFWSRTDNDETSVGTNWYRDAGASYVYSTNGHASAFIQSNGVFGWYTAASGTAGNAFTFTQAMTLDASGNLGIGTSSPSSRLHVQENGVGAYAFARVTNTSSTANLIVGVGGSAVANSALQNNAVIYNSGNSAMVFGTNDTERARITAGGNLLVGTTTDLGYAARLDVDSGGGETAAFKSSGGASSWVQRVWNSATSGDNLFVWFGTEAGGTTRGSITYNRGAGQVAYNITSDVRLKENISDAEEAGSKIDAMQVRQFDWKETGNHLDYGFVAQELHAVAPHAVSKPEDDDKMWSVDYSKLVPMLVKEIQSLRVRVAQLEAK